MSRNTEFMRRVFAGESPSSEQLRDYFRAFHADRPRATENHMRALRTGDGFTTYELLARALLEANSPREILEIGCGDGALVETLLALDRELVFSGIDLSEREIERLCARIPGDRLAGAVVGDAADMPFAADAFDAVASHMVLMLIPELEPVIGEVRRVLRSRGRFAFLVGMRDEEPGLLAELNASIVGWLRELHPTFTPINPADARIFTRDGIAEVLVRCGFGAEPAFVEQVVEHDVDLAQLWEQVVQRYYVGSLDDDEAMWLYERVARWMSPHATIRYREAVRIVSVNG